MLREECKILLLLIISFPAQMERVLFSKEPIPALSLGWQERHCAEAHENHEDTTDLQYFLEC